MNYKVLIVQPISKGGENYLIDKGYCIKRGTGTSEDAIAKDVEDCDAVLVRNAKITSNIIDAGKKLKVISRHGVGVDNIDVAYAKSKGIVVTNAPLSNFNAVSEHTIFLLLSCAKNSRIVDIAYRSGNYNIRNSVTNFELSGKTLGIVGLGRIGQCVAKKAIYGFDMNVLGYDPYVKADALDEKIVLKSTLEDVLNDSDYVTIHVPLTNETKGMFNKSAFASMKKGSILINTSRGEIINESDLLYALKHGQIAGGAFDLLCQEPPPIDHPLFEFQNVILTPHNAAHTYEAFENMALHAVQGVHEVLSGQMPTWPVMV